MNNMETFWSTSHAAGAQSSYLESLYESYLENPSSVPDDWKIYFESLPSINGAQKDVSHKEVIERFKEDEINPPIQSAPTNIETNSKQVRVIQLIQAYRNRGHQVASIDPLRMMDREEVPDLDIEYHGLSNDDLQTIFNTDTLNIGKDEASLQEIINCLQSIYCGDLGVEYNYIVNSEERKWFQEKLE